MGSEVVIVMGPWSFGLVTLGLLVVQCLMAQCMVEEMVCKLSCWEAERHNRIRM